MFMVIFIFIEVMLLLLVIMLEFLAQLEAGDFAGRRAFLLTLWMMVGQ